MKYLKKYEVSKMYDEKDIFIYLSNFNINKVKELIKNIPDINLNIKDKNGNTPLTYSILYSMIPICNLLIDSGADINLHNNGNETPLTIAVRSNKLSIVSKLIDSGADLNHQNNDGETALIICSTYTDQKHIEVLKKLIDAGADWNITDDYENTFLSYLLSNVRNEILKIYSEKYENYLIIKQTNKFNI